MKLAWAIGLILFTTTGCVSNAVIKDMRPMPRINMDTRDESLILEIDPSVENDFVVPKENVYASDMEVYGWHSSLRAAFDSGLKPFFAKSAIRSKTLTVARTKLFFDDIDSSSAMVATNKGSGMVQSIRIACTIQYQAAISDSSGKVLRKDIGEVRYSSGDWSRERMVKGAVEKMFEQIAKNLLLERIAVESKTRSDAANSDRLNEGSGIADP